MDLDTLKMIVALAEEKSVIRAAERLNISVKAVEDFCYDFKRETKTDFLDKAFMNDFLSGQGVELYEKAKKVLYDLETCGKWMNDLKLEPAGDITIVTMPFMGTEWLMPRIKPFLEKYPKVKVRLILKDPPIQAGEGDVVIAARSFIRPKGFISHDIISSTYSLYASLEYLEKRGTPLSPKDLDHHNLISFGYGSAILPQRWSLILGLKAGASPRIPYLEVNSIAGLINAAKLGLGIAELPDIKIITKMKELVKVLPEVKSSRLKLEYTVEIRREKTPLIRELYNFIKDDSIKLTL